jgi:hypothetical protein
MPKMAQKLRLRLIYCGSGFEIVEIRKKVDWAARKTIVVSIEKIILLGT